MISKFLLANQLTYDRALLRYINRSYDKQIVLIKKYKFLIIYNSQLFFLLYTVLSLV